jgi:multidrug resistance efflux pump
VLVRLEVPDLAARLAQKRAEVRQCEARLHLLEEEVAEQRRRVGRAERWRDRAEEDLDRAGRVLAADLAGLDQAIAQAEAEAEAAAGVFARSQAGRGAVSPEQLQEAERRNRAARAQVAQARADRRAREAKGVSEARLELDRRERDLAEDRAALAVLETGTRPKELDAERARLEGLRADEAYLLGVQARLVVSSPVPGVVTTPRLKEKVGQYVREGDLICLVEEPDALEAEVTVSEQDAGRVRVGQPVGLKARSLVSETFAARADRVAPAAAAGDGQSTVTVYCRLDRTPLRPGMSGYARVYGEPRSVGGFLLSRAVRFVRTEFWW